MQESTNSSCCFFNCASLRSLWDSTIPKPVSADGIRRRLSVTPPPHVQANSLLDESMGSVDTLPISKELLSTVRDMTGLNMELIRALDAVDSLRTRALLENGANPNYQPQDRKETPLMTACYNSDVESVQYLLRALADPNQCSNESRETPLMIAAENGLTDIVSELLRSKADPHVRNMEGETALLAAARTNNHDAFAVLVGSMVSAPPDFAGSDGTTVA
jgi:ankyrin repeat protein